MDTQELAEKLKNSTKILYNGIKKNLKPVGKEVVK